MITYLLYHYLLAHGVQYGLHVIVHHKDCPRKLSNEHRMHHNIPREITWYGSPTIESDFIGIYYIAFILYVVHIFVLYKQVWLHLLSFVTIGSTFLIFHGLCHHLSREQQDRIPGINVLFFHHYKHHILKSRNLGFGDILYDYIFGTLDLEPIELNAKTKERIDKKYFYHGN